MNRSGYLSLILHAHLPFVRHPEHADMMEERWLFEAITETYIPLLEAYEKLLADGIKFRITMSLTPPLVNMLSDSLLIARYSASLLKLEELAEKEIDRTRWLPEFHSTALMYREKFRRIRRVFEFWQGNLVQAFRHFQDAGVLEIITCCATHCFLPLINDFRPAVRAQIEMAVIDYQKHFKRQPRGIWLAECAYSPGDDQILRDFGIEYFFTDTHGILFAEPRPAYGVYAPVQCDSGVAAFGRDVESSRQVWSAHEGYPGDPAYREFYRDIGYDLELDYIRPYIHESRHRLPTGIKYHRITSRDSGEKQPYNYQEAMARVAAHAGHFIWCRERQIQHLAQQMDRQPIVVSPYDAELFGHWWYEGPDFIYNVLRRIACESTVIRLATPSDYLVCYPRQQKATPSLSSWGHKGYNEVWLDESNAWIYPHLHKASQRMIELADRNPDAAGQLRRALNQAARELMLLQSSDWAFIMKTGTTVEYAHKRTKDHAFRFNKLYQDISNGTVNENWLREVEKRDNIFPEMDYRIYRS
jgi:1,4-alpha-glucan branching enzyme